MSPETICAIAFSVYFLPSIMALIRSHPSFGGIFVTNLLLGWTFIGWVISFAWSLSDARRMKQTVIVNNSPPHAGFPKARNLGPLFRDLTIDNSAELYSDVQCPMCAENIKVGARKCRHCGEYFPAPIMPMRQIEAEWSEIDPPVLQSLGNVESRFLGGGTREPINPWMVALWVFFGLIALFAVAIIALGIALS